MCFRYLDDNYGNYAFNFKQSPMKSIPKSAMLRLCVHRTHSDLIKHGILGQAIHILDYDTHGPS